MLPLSKNKSKTSNFIVIIVSTICAFFQGGRCQIKGNAEKGRRKGTFGIWWHQKKWQEVKSLNTKMCSTYSQSLVFVEDARHLNVYFNKSHSGPSKIKVLVKKPSHAPLRLERCQGTFEKRKFERFVTWRRPEQ